MSADSRPSTPPEMRQMAGEFEWYHRIELGDGIVTPGRKPGTRRPR
jgi:hypothetical protein